MGGGLSKHEDEIKASSSSSSSLVEANPTTTTERSPPDDGDGTDRPVTRSACPMHKADGSYSYDWTSLFRAASVHGPKGSKPLPKEEQEKALREVSRNDGATSATTNEGCPVKHLDSVVQRKQDGCPVKEKHLSIRASLTVRKAEEMMLFLEYLLLSTG